MIKLTRLFMSVLISLVVLVLPGTATVQAQSTVPYRFYVWSDGNGNGVFDGSGSDICWRSARSLTVYGNAGAPIEPLYYFNLYNLSTYYPNSQNAVNQCMSISSPTKWLTPSYPFVALDNYSGALTNFTTVSGGTTTTYIGIQVPW